MLLLVIGKNIQDSSVNRSYSAYSMVNDIKTLWDKKEAHKSNENKYKKSRIFV